MTGRLFGETAQIQAFDRAAPTGLDRALAALVKRAYLDARDFCEQITGPEQDRDLRGDVKRAIVEAGLGPVASRFAGVVARTVPNERDSANHQELSFENVILTVSRTPFAMAALPEAKFRDTLASQQQGLFREYDAEPDASTGLFAVLVHGSPHPFDLVPTFLRIVFPTLGGVHGAGIDLYERHPALKPQPSTRPTFGLNGPRLRPGVDVVGEGEGRGS